MRIGTRLLFVALLVAALAAGVPAASAQEDLFDLFDDVFSDDGDDDGDDDRGQGQGVGQGGGPKVEGGGGGRGRGQGGGGGKPRGAPDRGVADILGDIGIDTAERGGGLGRGAIAMVDRIAGAPGSSVEELDPVYEGDSIDLGDDGELVLEFFDSCKRERIRGGIVRVGIDGSQVAGGRISTETTQCRQVAFLIPEQASEAGATVDRVTPNEATGDFWREQVMKTARPSFTWADKGIVEVRIIDIDRSTPVDIWQGLVAGGRLDWPEDAPALEIGRPYIAVVQGAAGTDSALFSIDAALDVGDDVRTSRVVIIGLL